MDAEIEIFLQKLPPEKQEILRGFQSPYQVQAYLDGLPYIAEERDRSPLDVMLDGQGHCLDGGLLAAVGLRYLGFTPVIIDLVPEPGKDDDHVLALFQADGLYGAVAKSNYVGLRYREPVYRSLRELVMSYFEPYFSVEGEEACAATHDRWICESWTGLSGCGVKMASERFPDDCMHANGFHC